MPLTLLTAPQALALLVIAKQSAAGTPVTRPQNGYCSWLELPPKVDALELVRLALLQGISITPGLLISAELHFGHCLPLNYGQARDARFEGVMQSVGQLACKLSVLVPISAQLVKDALPEPGKRRQRR